MNLTSEKDRWSEQMAEFKNHINNLLGDTFLSSSFLAYIGFYDAFYRKYLKDEQLAKAKEIIKNLMVFAEIDLRENEKEYKEAEQFLKEVSE